MSAETCLNGLNFCSTSGLLTATGAETVYDTTAVINFTSKGNLYQKAAVTEGETPTYTGLTTAGAVPTASTAVCYGGHTPAQITLVANHGTVVVWCLDKAGLVHVYKGSTVTLTPTGGFVDTPSFPGVPDESTPFAYQVIKAGSTTSNTWTFGSSNWNATGITRAIRNVAALPGKSVQPADLTFA